MRPDTLQLPVEAIMPELNHALATERTVVLQAPPGSGKTTRVPLALLGSSWLASRHILMLEPRRLAATNAARYMASLHNESVGRTIGYAIRYERKIGPDTRIEVITEGLLTRRLQSNPELSGIGLVIFDEFHERSLQADLALALCRDVQQELRNDLRILVMSATLDAEPLACMLGDCPIITTSGRSFPVTIDHLADADQFRIADAMALGIRRALKETKGDILAFFPGSGEIHSCCNLLQDLSPEIALRPLYGGLPIAAQEAAILPGIQRRVVLATNVAETSLTIEGIETVVDSGWERRPCFDAARGMTRLETLRISRASAEQRAGRAGRLGAGRCYRLWTEGTQGSLLPFAPPEIRQADLAPLAFELSQWGIHDAASLSWLDLPPDGHMTAARRLLADLGAISANGVLTALGHEMAEYPAHPRLARLLVAAIKDDCQGLGSDLVALLAERDLLAGDRQTARATGPSDLLDRLDILRREQTPSTVPVRRAASFWRKLTRAVHEPVPDADAVGRLLACAYPDRIGKQRKPGSQRYLLSNGQGVAIAASSVVRDAEWLVAVETVGHKAAEDEIRLASRLSRATVEELFGGGLEWRREAGWDDGSTRVIAREVRRIGAVVLQERPVATTVNDTLPALLDLIRHQGLAILPWTRESLQLRARAAFLHRQLAEQGWQDWSDKALINDLEEWLPHWLTTVKNRNDLNRIDLTAAFKARLGWQRHNQLDRLAPERLEVPSGSRIKLDYSVQDYPVLSVKLQEMFGLADTPRLADGRAPVLIHLLSPAGRPLAITRDLKNFWNTVYPQVQKEMKGRYPRHPWPDNPWQAEATRKVKRKA
ncbi:MAG: ATP-dependent helicase HrpB [Desulfuromonadales bacterium]|nr:ATP-dependent helicase HrpB [Desulfuromonadales bacterium]